MAQLINTAVFTLLQLTVSFVALVVNKSARRTCRLACGRPLLGLSFEKGSSMENVALQKDV